MGLMEDMGLFKDFGQPVLSLFLCLQTEIDTVAEALRGMFLQLLAAEHGIVSKYCQYRQLRSV